MKGSIIDSNVNTSASNIIAGSGTIINGSANAYNMSFISNHESNISGHPPSRGIGGRKMMAAVASGVIEEASPHSSKHDLVGSNNPTSAGGIYRKRF